LPENVKMLIHQELAYDCWLLNYYH